MFVFNKKLMIYSREYFGFRQRACRIPRPARPATRTATRHGRGRRRRVQDRARPAAQALPGSEGPGAGDVPAGLVAGTRSVRTGPRATGHRNGPKLSITRTKRRKPPHYKSGTKKTGHITRSAANCHAATIRAEQRWPRQPRRRAARASTIRSHEPAPPSSGLRQQNLRGGGAVLGVATQVAARSLDDLVDVDQPETVPLV